MQSFSSSLRTCGASLARASSRPSPSLIAATPILSLYQARCSSHSPMGTQSSASRKKVTIGALKSMHKKKEPITVMTAHDFPSAHVADVAGMDVILVGDSLAMVALGMEDTSEVLVEEMLLHCRSVARATKSAFTVSLSVPLISFHPSYPAPSHHISYHLFRSHPISYDSLPSHPSSHCPSVNVSSAC